MPLRNVVDTVIERTIVPSFSKVGPAVRRRLFDWEPVDTDMTGRTVVVTGSSSGLGREIASTLAGLGADVWVTSRSQERADEVAAEIGGTGHGVDIGEFDQVRAFAERLRTETDHIDVLIHNAGALTEDRRETSAGVEATLATHLLGPYLLTRSLEDHFADGARILFMSSGGMYTQGLHLPALEMAPDRYKGTVAYARAKRAQVVLVRRLAEEYGDRFVVHAAHPGWAATPGVTAGIPAFDRVMGPLLRTPADGADTMLWLATAGDAAATSGDFWHDRARRSTVYVPSTRVEPDQEAALIPWIEARIEEAERG